MEAEKSQNATLEINGKMVKDVCENAQDGGNNWKKQAGDIIKIIRNFIAVGGDFVTG